MNENTIMLVGMFYIIIIFVSMAIMADESTGTLKLVYKGLRSETVFLLGLFWPILIIHLIVFKVFPFLLCSLSRGLYLDKLTEKRKRNFVWKNEEFEVIE